SHLLLGCSLWTTLFYHGVRRPTTITARRPRPRPAAPPGSAGPPRTRTLWPAGPAAFASSAAAPLCAASGVSLHGGRPEALRAPPCRETPRDGCSAGGRARSLQTTPAAPIRPRRWRPAAAGTPRR